MHPNHAGSSSQIPILEWLILGHVVPQANTEDLGDIQGFFN